MTQNSRIIVARHYVCDDDTFDTLEQGIPQLLDADIVARERNNGIQFGLKLTVHEKYRNDQVMLEKIAEKLKPLYNGFYVLFDPQSRGPGTSYAQILFNPTFWTKPHTVATTDLGQYILTTNDAHEQIEDLFGRMEKDGAVYATGSRDVPVKLAIHQDNSDMRIIHELVHSLTIGTLTDLRVHGKVPVGVTPAYAAIGESTSGFYVYNTRIPAFAGLVSSVLKQIQAGANFTHFGMDYYCAIQAAQFGNISNGYVQACENVFYGTKTVDEEHRGIVNFLSARSSELSTTDVSELVRQTLKKKDTKMILSNYYSPALVDEVLEIMDKEFY